MPAKHRPGNPLQKLQQVFLAKLVFLSDNPTNAPTGAKLESSVNINPSMAPFLASIAPPQSVVHQQTHCSQCGQPQGPGAYGYSSCKQHTKLPSFQAVIGENITVLVVYEYTPAEAAVYDVNSPVCGPGHDAEVDVIEVLLDGVDLRDVLADSVIEFLEEQAFARVAA